MPPSACAGPTVPATSFHILSCSECGKQTRRPIPSPIATSGIAYDMDRSIRRTNFQIPSCPCGHHTHQKVLRLPRNCHCKYAIILPKLICWCCQQESWIINSDNSMREKCQCCGYTLDSTTGLLWVVGQYRANVSYWMDGKRFRWVTSGRIKSEWVNDVEDAFGLLQ